MPRYSVSITLLCVLIPYFQHPADSFPQADFLKPVNHFSLEEFQSPEAIFWPAYFWLWNGEFSEEVLRRQLEDMASHGAKSVAVLPMPHGFRPDSTNNQMEPDYLTEEYFQRVKFAAGIARQLGMNWWLYDEGGWPSGRALGKVIEGHPELVFRRLSAEVLKVPEGTPWQVPQEAFALVVAPAGKTYKPGDEWVPQPGEQGTLFSITTGDNPAMMNRDATRRFIQLTHEGYKSAIGDLFGSTVKFTFTDEPAVIPPIPERSLPWHSNMEEIWLEKYGEPIHASLPSLLKNPESGLTQEDQLARVRFYDLWTAGFRDGYFIPLRDWARSHHLASGGHLGGEDETIFAVHHGFGHVLRQLRQFDIPGVDLIWRQLFPGWENQSDFPILAPSVAHQNGTRFAFTESFCVYGNGLTPEEMRWLTDYQYVRGLNLMVIGCYPLSTHDHHMTGERPHFGPCNPLWDHLPGYHAYTARTGYALSVGKPVISTAVYYPVRDMWALGPNGGRKAADSMDRLVRTLLSNQCGVDLIDDDLLSAATTQISDGKIKAGSMEYASICVGEVSWMEPESLRKLEQLAEAGGKVFCVSHVPGTTGDPGEAHHTRFEILPVDEIGKQIQSMASFTPASSHLRVSKRQCDKAAILFIFNEGDTPYQGSLAVDEPFVCRLEPLTGKVCEVLHNQPQVPIQLLAGESMLLLLSGENPGVAPRIQAQSVIMQLDDKIQAFPRRQFVAGEHDFVINMLESTGNNFKEAACWKDFLSEDFSGEVDYKAHIDLPMELAEAPLRLEVGGIEYAATVILDGKEVGYMPWPPWQIDLPAMEAGSHELVIRVANTLANELTSQRVVDQWSARQGPGWPSPYHARALEFEKESRKGGLKGPVRLERLSPTDPSVK